ncbi:MAG: tetratricopeptide repeat protein [Magnetococcus sp. MYC-9]
MLWIWVFPALLMVSLAIVFQPLFSRQGQRPLPQGLEGDARMELLQQRERLLRQLKEWQLEEGREASGEALAIHSGMEQELAAVLARLDRLPGEQRPEGKGSALLPVQRSAVDMGFATAVLVLLMALATGLYLGLGKTVSMAERGASPGMGGAAPTQEQLLSAVQRLSQRLEQEPDNLSGWLHLARSHATLGNLPEAMRAYRHLLSRQGDHLEATLGLAELQIQSGEGEQIAQGRAALDSILARDPNQPDALWLGGAAAARAGERAKAVALWQRLLPLLQDPSEARSMVEAAIQELGRASP